MTEGTVAILIALISLAGQAVNVVLHLRIRNAILEADKQATKEREERLKEYVLLELCDERHHVRRQRA